MTEFRTFRSGSSIVRVPGVLDHAMVVIGAVAIVQTIAAAMFDGFPALILLPIVAAMLIVVPAFVHVCHRVARWRDVKHMVEAGHPRIGRPGR